MTSLTYHLASKLSHRSGYIMALSTLSAGLYYVFHSGPKLENSYYKYALAGSTATVFCGVGVHALDTLNMKSKIIDGHKVFVFELLR